MWKLIGRVVTFDLSRGELKIKNRRGNEFTFNVLPLELVGIEENDEVQLELSGGQVKSVIKTSSFKNRSTAK
jgi:hypothetical protein